MASGWTRCTGDEAASKLTKGTLARILGGIRTGGEGAGCRIDRETESTRCVAQDMGCTKGVCRRSRYRRMKMLRRTLTYVATLLIGFDLFVVLVAVAQRERVWVTHVGLDSASYLIPLERKAAMFRQNRWQPKLDATKIESVRRGSSLAPVDYISLSSTPTFGQFLDIVRDLKQRDRYNVLMHYPGIGVFKPDSAETGLEPMFDVPALVLCGEALGDAGISDPIADDGFMFVPREEFGSIR